MQLTERIFVGKNKQMDILSRKQTTVYNQALYILRRGYFWWKYLEPGWRTCYSNGRSPQLSRGLFVSKGGKHIHADVNGAYNILRKGCPNAFSRHTISVKLYPRRIDVSINERRKKSPDIFGWNGAGVRHHPKPVNNPVPS